MFWDFMPFLDPCDSGANIRELIVTEGAKCLLAFMGPRSSVNNFSVYSHKLSRADISVSPKLEDKRNTGGTVQERLMKHTINRK